jgi:hypothetical protein
MLLSQKANHDLLIQKVEAQHRNIQPLLATSSRG